MNAHEAVAERYRKKEYNKACKRCVHSWNDVTEGWNCKKYEDTITLASGKQIPWYGQACDKAYNNDCRGEGFAEDPFATFKSASDLVRYFILFGFLPVYLTTISMLIAEYFR